MRWLAAFILMTLSASAARAETASSPAINASADIETVGFYTAPNIGMGGMVIFEPRPIVLFRNGEALRKMEALNDPGGLAAHKAAHPRDWTRWRRGGGQIQVQGEGGWEDLPYTKVMDPLPRGHRLSATFQRLRGGGNTALGGGAMIAAWASFTFDGAGRFTTGGGAGASFRSEGPSRGVSVTTQSTRPPSGGRYEIEGYTLTLTYDDGRVERRLIVTDPSDPKSALWIDGDGYARR